jgi:hypothetical protein
MGVFELAEEERGYALGLLLQTGALTNCRIHEDCIYEGNAELEPAYKIASASFKRGDLDIFTDQRDVTDTIKDVFEEYAGIDYCPSCNKND